MEVAFGALSVVGVAIQLFEAIKESYVLLSTAKGLEKDAPILLWKLRIQQIRFVSWGRHFGADSGDLDARLRENGLFNMVFGLLQQTQAMLDHADTLASKYGVHCQQGSSSVPPMGAGVATKPMPSTKAKLSARVRWAISDKTKFATLIADLKDFNDGLDSLLRPNENASIDELVHSAILRWSHNANQVANVNSACRELKESSVASTPNTRLLYDHIQTSALSKLAIMSSDDKDSAISQRRSRGQIEIMRERAPSEFRTTGKYRIDREEISDPEVEGHVNVLIEWKEFDPKSPVKALIDRRVNRIAELLSPKTPKPSDFRIQPCLGFFEDHEFSRYGMLFRLPHSERPQSVSLYDMLGRNEEPYLPDLGDKFELAKVLVTAILRLHDCGWVHGSLRSNNILFIVGEEESEARHLRDPYIHGFMFSRPTDPSEITLEYSRIHFEHDLYRHPHVAQFASRKVLREKTDHQRFQTFHDLYALGIVLLEIGLWRRISTLWKDKYTQASFQKKLVAAYVPRLGPKMGTIYREMVQQLLNIPVTQEHHQYKERGGAEQDSEIVSDDYSEGSESEILPGTYDVTSHWEFVAKLAECRV